MGFSIDRAIEIKDSIIAGFEDPQMMHAVVVHLPIVLSLVAFLWVAVLIMTGCRSHKLRFSGVLITFLGGVLAWWAHETGETAAGSFKTEELTEAAQAVLNEHARLGEFLWIGFCSTSLLLLLSLTKAKWFRWLMTFLALLASTVTVLWVAGQAHLGGELVYKHGVGVPTSDNNIDNVRKQVPIVVDDTDGKVDPQKDKPQEISWTAFVTAAESQAFVGEVTITTDAVVGQLDPDKTDHHPEGVEPPYKVMAPIGDLSVDDVNAAMLKANQPVRSTGKKSGFFGLSTD